VTRQGETVEEGGDDGLTVTTTGNVGLSDELNLFVGVGGAGLRHGNGSVHDTGGDLLTVVEEAALLTLQVRQTETSNVVSVLLIELQSDGVSSGQGGKGHESLGVWEVRFPPDVSNIRHWRGQVNTPGPVPQVSQVRQHFIQGSGVDRAVHPAGTVRGHLPPHHLQAGDEAIVGVVTLGDLVGRLIVADPEGDVPGCPVCPSVESGCGHVVCGCESIVADRRGQDARQ